ncbi:ATP-binding protein [Streptomyces sp. RY43-2]|uniref:histidine kinase n=1 Tax=Streptomyces macrolidinus TaxID=2952607 RepID=A0ABT0ZKE7_9ACTN|nr:ATP-binding protein [Streptomyces macrolidinus]MCN9244060.1 ATP-binding protein [Streptomyces macrolidinus]
MSVPAPPSQHRPAKAPRTSPTTPLAVLVVSAAAGGGAVALAPSGARTWALAVAAVAWVCVAATVVVSHQLVQRARRTAAAQTSETGQLKAQSAQMLAQITSLANVTLPAVAQQLRDGTSAADVLSSVPLPSDPLLGRIVHTFAAAVEEDVRHAVALEGERQQARSELNEVAAALDQLTQETLLAAVARLREGQSADTVLAELDLPRLPMVRIPAESFIRELARSERRAAAGQAASAKALSRVQAKSVSMLADLRDMQERHGEEVFGDLLKLDHSTSQLGLMTDRLALLMGGRSSRAWNKPIVMESILRGAVGRIAAYQRVRLHCSTTAAISGFAAEGVMHLLAELMDNAANFSPPIDEVHVYVEDRSAGMVVTIEDSGLKMADAAMRHAEEAVSGRMTDLASLQGTRLGLAVVGRLAAKYGISVNYRPSSRGGTGVVVLLPPQLLAQQRESVSRAATDHPTPAPAPAPAPEPTSRPGVPERPAARPELPEQRQPRRATDSTPNGLPVRAPGRTMAEAEREREQRRSVSRTADEDRPESGAGEQRPARDAGARFGAFHRGRRSAIGAAKPDARSEAGGIAKPDARPETGGTAEPDARPGSEPPVAP